MLRENVAQRCSLRPARIVQGNVANSLNLPQTVPFGLAVSNKEKTSHGVPRSLGGLPYKPRPSTIAPRVPDVPPSILTVAMRSAFVGPRLMMTIGIFRLWAILTNRIPVLTTSDDPATTRASDRARRPAACSKTEGGTNSPKKITSGLRTPSHVSHRGTTNSSVTATSTSPSGRICPPRSVLAIHGLRRSIAPAIAPLVKDCPQ